MFVNLCSFSWILCVFLTLNGISSLIAEKAVSAMSLVDVLVGDIQLSSLTLFLVLVTIYLLNFKFDVRPVVQF